jgi:nitrogen regulatory protein P-II 2
MCNTIAMQRVVLIADSVLEQRLVSEIERLGFVLHTRADCNGQTARAVMRDEFAGREHVRLEAIGTRDVALDLMDFVQQVELRRYAITTYMDVVEMDERAVCVRGIR